MNCPCGSSLVLAECCGPVIDGTRPAATAERLMRARYTAYTQAAMDFLEASLHPNFLEGYDGESAGNWARKSEWHELRILDTRAGGPDDDTGRVEFVASYTFEGEDQQYHEVADFEKIDGRWYFKEGKPGVKKPLVREEPKIGRNDHCSCGSGKKFKRCCGV